MDAEIAEQLLDALAAPMTTVAQAERIMARFDGHEVEAVLPVFRRLHDAADQPTLHASARLLARWSGRPVARALVPALEALLAEAGVGDLNKLAAAGVLETLGQPVDYPALLGRLDDLGAVARSALGAALAAAEHPVALVNFVDQLGRMPPDRVLAVIDEIPPTQAGAARPILAALTHSRDPDLAVSAIAAIDELGLRAAAGPLARVAAAHADALVREQARRTLRRLVGPAGGDNGAGVSTSPAAPTPQAEPSPLSATPATPTTAPTATPMVDPPAPPAGAVAYLSTPGPEGGQLLLLAIPSRAGKGWVDILTVYATAAGGVREHGTVEGAAPERFQALRAECAAGGVPLARADWAAVLGALEAAIRRALRAGGMSRPGPAAWLAALETGP